MSDILVAVSGGVDSSVAAYLLKKEGNNVSGVYMRLAHDKDESGDAFNAAKNLSIDFHVYDKREQFKKIVVSRFAREYYKGLTPNPCVFCNENMKFPSLFEKADELGISLTATGHYAGIYERGGVYYLRKSKNTFKDQSYMLYRLNQKMLSRLVFPIGDMNKDDVRALAEEGNIPVAHKADSQDICFVPNGDYRPIIAEYCPSPSKTGDFVYEDGRIIGKDIQANRILLGKNESLFTDSLSASVVVYCSEQMPEVFRCEAKVRYSHGGALCTVTKTGENTVKVVFDTPQRAITPGQSVVFYDGETVIGGGYID